MATVSILVPIGNTEAITTVVGPAIGAVVVVTIDQAALINGMTGTRQITVDEVNQALNRVQDFLLKSPVAVGILP